jgi:hypothetical protein
MHNLIISLIRHTRATITTDAMGCQFKIANQIVNTKADYVLALKGSQGEFFNDVQFFLDIQIREKFKNTPHIYFKSVNGGHGCIEQGGGHHRKNVTSFPAIKTKTQNLLHMLSAVTGMWKTNYIDNWISALMKIA